MVGMLTLSIPSAILALVLSASPVWAQMLRLEVARATAEFDTRTGEPVLALTLNARGARAFGRLTRANIGRRVRVALDGRTLASPVVRETVRTGLMALAVGVGIRETTELAETISKRGTIEVEVMPDR